MTGSQHAPEIEYLRLATSKMKMIAYLKFEIRHK